MKRFVVDDAVRSAHLWIDQCGLLLEWRLVGVIAPFLNFN